MYFVRIMAVNQESHSFKVEHVYDFPSNRGLRCKKKKEDDLHFYSCKLPKNIKRCYIRDELGLPLADERVEKLR